MHSYYRNTLIYDTIVVKHVDCLLTAWLIFFGIVFQKAAHDKFELCREVINDGYSYKKKKSDDRLQGHRGVGLLACVESR